MERTQSFAELVESAIPRRAGFKERIHPATRTFQGVRIAINDELKSIEAGLEEGFRRLKVNSVMAHKLPFARGSYRKTFFSKIIRSPRA